MRHRVRAQVGEDIGQDNPAPSRATVPIGSAELADAFGHPVNGAVDAGAHPALALRGGIFDPARAGPGTQKQGRPLLVARPRYDARSVNRLALPGPPHHREIFRQGFEAALVVRLNGLEIALGRAGADAQTQTAFAQNVQGHHAMRQLHRMAQRDLQDTGAKFNSAGNRRHRAQQGQWVQAGHGTSYGISDPKAGKIQLLGQAANLPQARRHRRAIFQRHRCRDYSNPHFISSFFHSGKPAARIRSCTRVRSSGELSSLKKFQFFSLKAG